MQIPFSLSVDTSATSHVPFEGSPTDQTMNRSSPLRSASLPTLSPLAFASDGSTLTSDRPVYAPSGVVTGASPSYSPAADFPSSSQFKFPPVLTGSRPPPPLHNSLSNDPFNIETPPRSRNSSASSTLSSRKSDESSPDEPYSDHPLIAPASLAIDNVSSKKRARLAADVEGQDDAQAKPRSKLPSKHPNTTSFIYKLFDILEDPANVNMISYGLTPGTFQVHDTLSLARNVLPRYFRHSNFASFSRQLNMWGWRKESRHGGWSFVHPTFRAGRRDLLAEIKRADEAGKKRPETVGSLRRGPSRPLEPPRGYSTPNSVHSHFSLDTCSTSSPKDLPPPHTRYAVPPLRSPSQQWEASAPPVPPNPEYEDHFDSSIPHSPALSLSISPLFHSDGSHPRPVSPPSFVNAPRPHLESSSIYREVPRERRSDPDETLAVEVQFAEAKKRLEMTTTLLEHVLHRLGADTTDERFRSFPFYVLDPRFVDPTTPMQTIMADFDARKAASQSVASTASSFSSAKTSSARPPASSLCSDTSRHGSFDSAQSTTSPLDTELHGLGISVGGQDYYAARHGEAGHTGSQGTKSQARTGLKAGGRGGRGGEGRRQLWIEPPRGLRQRPSSTARTAATPTLGPSSFSLVDFSTSRPGPTSRSAESTGVGASPVPATTDFVSPPDAPVHSPSFALDRARGCPT